MRQINRWKPYWKHKSDYTIAFCLLSPQLKSELRAQSRWDMRFKIITQWAPQRKWTTVSSYLTSTGRTTWAHSTILGQTHGFNFTKISYEFLETILSLGFNRTILCCISWERSHSRLLSNRRGCCIDDHVQITASSSKTVDGRPKRHHPWGSGEKLFDAASNLVAH